MQIRTYRLKWTKYTCCRGKSDWGFNDKKWVPTASMLWVWPAGLRQVQQQGMNAHQGVPKCSKSIGMFRSREASKSISYFSNLARDCSIPENCSLWQIQFSTWCLPPVSKSLRLRKTFFPLILTILQPFDLFYAVKCLSQGKRNQAMLLLHHLIMKQLSNKTETQKGSNHERMSEFLF